MLQMKTISAVVFKYLKTISTLYNCLGAMPDFTQWKFVGSIFTQFRGSFKSASQDKQREDTLFFFSVVKEDRLPVCYQFICENIYHI